MGKKILLADDSITIQKVIELTFSEEDFEVVTVGNGRLALEKLKEVQPDIVLCDIIMPEKDGYEVCEHVKTSPGLSHIPVLLLTGAFEPFDQERAERVGSNGFLAKPFEPETLIAKVKDLLSRAPARGEGAGAADLGVTAPQPTVSPGRPAPAPPEDASPRLEEVPPAVPLAARATAPPEGASLIPEEPFEAFDAGAGEEPFADSRPQEPPEPLAPVSDDELATLAGGPEPGPAPPGSPSGGAEPDSASTVMFSAGDLPWQGEGEASPEPPPPPPAEAPPPEDGPPEPVLTPERPVASDLAEQTGAAFEEVLEEDLEFGASGLSPGTPGSDTQAPIAPDVLPDAMQESATFETVEPPAVREEVEPETPPVFEAESSTASEEPPELELDATEISPAQEAPPAPEAPPVHEVGAPPEPEAPPAYEPFTPRAPEAPPAYESFAPREPEAPPVYEPQARPELEGPPAHEAPVSSEPEAPPVYEPFAPPEPEAGPSLESEASPEPPGRESASADESFTPAEPPAPPPPPPPPPDARAESEGPALEPEAPQLVEAEPPHDAYPPLSGYESQEPERPETTLPPLPPEPPRTEETRTAPTPVVAPPPPPAEREPEAPPAETDVTPELEPPPTFAEAPSLVEESAELEGEPSPVAGEPAWGAGREEVVESFADVDTGGETEEPTLPPSEAGSVPVPVDMVEKIAQRVVGQVSEKVVREIAGEVIPDLAEALIKREIERLKEELQKL